MASRLLAPACLLLLSPSLALAAPPDDRPAVQVPSSASPGPEPTPGEGQDSGEASDQNPEQDVTADTGDAAGDDSTAAADAAAAGDEGAASPESDNEIEDGDENESAAAASHSSAEGDEAKTSEPEEDLSNLLVSDEPEDSPRVRVTNRGQPERVDRSERLRNYYAQIYRPAHNPSRLHFAARGAYSLAGTSEGFGGGRMAFVNAEIGQTWNFISYALGPTVYAGSLTFGEDGVEKFGGLLFGGGPSLGIGRLALLGRGYFEPRIGYNFFYAPISTTRAGVSDPPDAAPHGPKVQLDAGLLLHDSERRRFRHGFGASLGWQILVHSLAGEYPVVNMFNVGVSYFFG